ncbi:MAG: 3-dehydroquinate synthase [Planctomycetes bacterium]|nr:3-dehydroquinate synthase [Planctomycetota bacterium]
MQTVRVNLGPRSYDIALTAGDSAGIGPFARAALPKSKLAFIVSDANTQSHALAVEQSLKALGFGTAIAKVPAGEESKSQAELSKLYDALYEVAADRSTVVVAVGGGVVGDLAGFAAASYNRGLPLLMVPTTLLSMVDSSVGGKTGINHAKGKNLIGAFHQPSGVWIDTEFLRTLPEREFLSGLAEVVKYGVILDVTFFEWLEANAAAIRSRDAKSLIHVIARSCQLKADVVEKDEREETGLRAVLNYGHTFAHAFETVGSYGAWLHGEAVAAGMVCASKLAVKLGMIAASITERQVALLNSFSLPTAPRHGWDTDKLIAVMRRDKKSAAGKLRFILPTRLGEVKLVGDVPEELVRDVLEGR